MCRQFSDTFVADNRKQSFSAMTRQRDEALYAQFKKTWGEHPELSSKEVIRLVLRSPQPRMWVSFNGVYRILRKILYNSWSEPKRHARTGLVAEVERKYMRLKQQPIFREASAYFLAAFIIAEPSRGFYVSPGSAYNIIRRTRKAHLKKAKRP